MMWSHLLLRHDLSQLDWYILLRHPPHTYPLSFNVPQIHLVTWHISESHAERTPQAFLWESSTRTNSSQENISANLMNLPLTMILMLICTPVLIYRNHIWHWWILPSSYAWCGKHSSLVTCHLPNVKWNLGSMTHFAITFHNHTIGAVVSNSKICHLLIQRENTQYFELLPCCREFHKTVVKDSDIIMAIW